MPAHAGRANSGVDPEEPRSRISSIGSRSSLLSEQSNPAYSGPDLPVIMSADQHKSDWVEMRTPAAAAAAAANPSPGEHEPMVVEQTARGHGPVKVSSSSVHVEEDETVTMRNRRQRRERTYESLNYARMMNQTYYNNVIHAGPDKIKQIANYKYRLEGYKWLCCGLIGFGTAASAFFIDYNVDLLATWKFDTVTPLWVQSEPGVDRKYSPVVALLTMLTFNLGFVLISSLMVVLIAECALGSGIPEIKCFLNGIRHPGWLNAKTMVVKVVGVLFSVGATMPIGKEGPMIHSGAIWGAGLPQTLFGGAIIGKDRSELFFHNDRAKRDFVSAGAAAGVAAAFGSPIGGVLFSLEEGCSFWSQALTWRVFFCSMSSLFMLNFLTSGILNADKPGGGWGKLASGGMIDFGRFQDEVVSAGEQVYLYDMYDLVFFIAMGIGGGLLGGLWNWLQTELTKYRMRRQGFTKVWKVAEALMFAFLNTVIMFGVTFSGKCTERVHNASYVDEYLGEMALVQFDCADHEFNDAGTLTFNTLENSIRNMFHVKADFHYAPLGWFFLGMFVTSCWTYGLYIPSGLFVPSLATGAAYGRMVGQFVHTFKPTANVGVYALVGAASFLGGVVRMTISLTVILVEATDNVIFSFPIMLSLLCAKWVGDHFNVGIYDIHIHLKKIPMLEATAEHAARRLMVEDVMTPNVVCLPKVVRISSLIAILTETTYNGYPVVETYKDAHGNTKRRLLGVVVRYQLIILLKNHVWGRKVRGGGTTQPLLPHKTFVKDYRWHRKTNIEDVENFLPTFAEQESLFMDVSLYMDISPITVQPKTTVLRAYSIFRGLGLRHLVVVDSDYCVVGMITRKELTEHAFEHAGETIDARHQINYGRVQCINGHSESLDVNGNNIYEDAPLETSPLLDDTD